KKSAAALSLGAVAAGGRKGRPRGPVLLPRRGGGRRLPTHPRAPPPPLLLPSPHPALGPGAPRPPPPPPAARSRLPPLPHPPPPRPRPAPRLGPAPPRPVGVVPRRPPRPGRPVDPLWPFVPDGRRLPRGRAGVLVGDPIRPLPPRGPHVRS